MRHTREGAWAPFVRSAMALLIGTPMVVAPLAGTQPLDGRSRRYEEHLRVVLPEAEVFEHVDGTYRHFRGYVGGPAEDERQLVGYAFFTTDLGARSRGYSGVMHIMIGMNARGTLTGVTPVDHREPYGYRSIDLPEYGEQFRGKTVLEPFTVGEDVDAVSGATITVRGATGAVKVASRRMAREFIVKRTQDEP